MGQMKNYTQLIKELPSNTIVFAFGRFNPPTTGHELLVKAVKKLAQQKRADHVIYASRSQDAKKNPLTVERKVHYLNMMFPQTHFVGANDHVRTFIEAAKELNKKYKNIIMVAGSDRVSEFNRLLNTYNGKEFNFDTIEVISAGERDPDSDTASGMSATKMREAAKAGRYEDVKNAQGKVVKGFKTGLPSTMRDIDGRRLMNDIRMGMGMQAVREQVVFEKDELREQYFRGEIFNVGDIVESENSVYAIVKRGSNHLLVQGTDGQMVSKWIKDVSLTQREFMLDEELTQKTLRPTDKIKVARVLATMLGVEKPESSANPENLINLGLRRIRTKALNPEALAIVDKMLKLATQMGIQYDTSLLPSKLKEAAVIVVPKEVMSFKDFDKIKKQQNIDAPTDPINTSDKDAEEDPEHDKNDAEVGGILVTPHPGADDNLRRRKVKYQLGESEDGIQSTAQHQLTASSKEHSKKEKKLAQSFINRMQGVVEASDPAAAAAERAAKETAKAQLSVKHAKEKEALQVKQAADREKLKTESLLSFKNLYAAEEEIDEAAETGLAAKAKKSGVSLSTLKKVYARGVAAWNSGHRPGTTPQQWGMARVNSYITKGKGTYHGADKDLREEQIDEKIKEVPKDKESGLPKKYVAGLSASTAKARAAHWDKMDKKSDSDPSAYEPAPGDASAKTKESKHTKKYRDMYGEQVETDDSDYEKMIAILDFSDDSSEDEIDKIVAELSDDDIMDEVYDDDEVVEIDDETGEEIEQDEEDKKIDEQLTEVLSRMQRIKAKQRLRRTAAKRKRSTKIALKKYSSSKTINKRARRAAVKALKNRLLRGRNPNKLSVGEKERVERIIASKKSLVNRIALKMVPRVRKIEKARMSHSKVTKGSTPSVF